MLILNLMSSCNCKCPFCCVRDEIARSQVIPPEYLKARIAEQPRDTIIDFFGGEPTLYPHFFEILSYAREKGHKCRIATNGRIFSSSKFSKRVAELGVDQIRTSIYGHTDELHDYHTDAKHSFKQTVNGIRNLLNLNINLFVNTVITSKNVYFLPEIVEMLHDLGVKNIKFGSLTDSQHVLDLIPDPEEVRTFLRAALNHAEQHHMAYALEKSPLCLIPNHYEVCVYEPDEYLYQKLEACVECIGREMCVGFPKEQVYKFGQLIAQPLPSESTSPELLLPRIMNLFPGKILLRTQ